MNRILFLMLFLICLVSPIISATGKTVEFQHDGASGTNLYVDTNGGAYAAVFDGGDSGFGEINPDAKVQIFEDLNNLATTSPSQSDSYQVYINGANGTTGDTVGIALSTTDANDYVSAAIYAEDTGSAGIAELVLTNKRTTGIAEAARFDDAGNFVMADGNIVIPNGNRLQFKDNGGSPQQILKLDTNNQTYLYSPNGFNLNIDSGKTIKLYDDTILYNSDKINSAAPNQLGLQLKNSNYDAGDLEGIEFSFNNALLPAAKIWAEHGGGVADDILHFGTYSGGGAYYYDTLEITQGQLRFNGITNANNYLIKNIGNAGTDFTASGGLTLADKLTVSDGGITLTDNGNTCTLTVDTDGTCDSGTAMVVDNGIAICAVCT